MATPLPRALGELEADVMDVLWQYGPLSVGDVHLSVKRKPALAYTTVLTVLDRLHAKGFVDRVKDGKAFIYSPRVSREAWLGENAAQLLTAGQPAPSTGVLLAFLESAERADPGLLARLSELIESRKGRR